MSIESIGRVNSVEGNISQQGVGLSDFLEIFLTELNFQDPLKPVDNREFIAQLAQFSSLEISNQTNENVSGVLSVEAVGQTVSLIGRQVQVTNDDGNIVVGQVVAVSMRGEQPLLTLKLGEDNFVEGINPSTVTVIR